MAFCIQLNLYSTNSSNRLCHFEHLRAQIKFKTLENHEFEVCTTHKCAYIHMYMYVYGDK